MSSIVPWRVFKKLSSLVAIMFGLLLCPRIVHADLAPDFVLTDVDGNSFSLGDFRGRVVILDFFATYCSACIEEMPQLKVVYNTFGSSIAIISISVWESITDAALRQFRSDCGLVWVVARDTAGVVGKYGVSAIPTLCIVDQSGFMRYQHVGLVDQSVLAGEINGLFVRTFSLTVKASSSLSNVHFRIDGGDYFTSGGSFSVELNAGTHQIQLVDTAVKESNDVEYRFSSWSGIGSGCANPIQVEITCSSALEADFSKYCKIVFTQSGGEGALQVTVDGTPYPLPQTLWFESGSQHSFNYEPASGGIGIQYTPASTSYASPITVGGPTTVTSNYRTQYYVTVTSEHGDHTPSQWVDKSASLVTTVTSPADDNGAGMQYRCTGYKTNDANLQPGTSYIFENVQAPQTIDFQWIPQYRLVVSSEHGSPDPSDAKWYDSGACVSATVTSPTDDDGAGTRYTCTGWTGTGSVPATGTDSSTSFHITSRSSITWKWVPQYRLTVNTIPSGLIPQPLVSISDSWHDAKSLVTCEAQALNKCCFNYWILDGIPQEAENTLLVVTMDKPRNASAHYTAAADLDFDGKIDEDDMAIIITAFRSKLGDKNYDPKIDFNNDEVIDIIDVSIAAKDFGELGP